MERVQDTREELRRTLNSALDFKYALDEHAIVATTDERGEILYVNRKFCEISGYDESELLGQNHRILNSGYHPKEFFDDLWSTIGGGSVWRGEIRNRRKDGSTYWVDTTIVPFSGDRDRPPQYISIRTDITRRKQYEEQLKGLAQERDRKNRELQSVIYAASHDLRSPLVNVQGFASLLKEHVGGMREILGKAADGVPPARDAIEEMGGEMELALGFIRAGAVKMDALLNGLLSISRLDSANILIEDLDANEVVRSNLAAMKFQIEDSKVDVVIRDLPMVRGDRALLGRVFSNLFENALKYAAADRNLIVEISGELEGDEIVFRVRDNGIGIADQFRHRVFELFHRLNPAKGDGHGVGLAIVKGALERMGGRISVCSEEGEGSVFIFALPTCFPN